MPVRVSIVIHKEVDDIDKAHDLVDEVRELLQGNVNGTLQSNVSNSTPPEVLTKEQESE